VVVRDKSAVLAERLSATRWERLALTDVEVRDHDQKSRRLQSPCPRRSVAAGLLFRMTVR
jgi:hypothetical protein